MNYLEIPLNIAFKMNNFQFYAGPYLAIGIGGKIKYDITTIYSYNGTDHEFKNDGEFDIKVFFKEVKEEDLDLEKEYPLRGLDYGLNIGLGYKVGPILVNGGYSIGLSNILPELDGADISKFKQKRNH